ncbi:MAG TPA: hypothetical protein VNU26_08790 [Mycobacteriales bacterium]|nr:hypothetical protein [Mycobacteriales bacterium]
MPLSTRRALAAVVVVVSTLAVAPAGADTAGPTVTDLCDAPLADQVPLDDPLSTSGPEPAVASIDICASWYLPVVDAAGDLAAVEFRTDVAGDVADLPADSYFTWDWFSEDGTCYHQAVVSRSPSAGVQAFVRDECDGTPPPPLVDFFLGYVAAPPVVPVPTDGVAFADHTVTLRIELAGAPARIREILGQGRVLARPHTHSGTLHRGGGEPYVADIETASDGAQDVPLR